MSKPIPVTIIYPGPSPHAVDFFDALDRSSEFDVEVLFCLPKFGGRAGWPVPALSFRHEFLSVRRLSKTREFAVWNPGLSARARAAALDGRIILIGGGYTMPSVALAMISLNLARARWWYFSEKPGISPNPVRSAVRRALIKMCLGGCSGILAHSPLAIEAYRSLGFPEAKLTFLPYYMRVDDFLAIRRDWSEFESRPLRVLYCGQLHPIKGIDWALRALAAMPELRSRWELSIVGEGPLRGELEKFASTSGMSNVRFLGPAAWSDRWRAFAEHDLLLLPSLHDGWGMVVMEALASGMGVIGSANSGAVQAFIEPRRNGLIVPYGDDQALREGLLKCINGEASVRAMGEAARDSISGWNPEAGACNLADLLRANLSSTQS